MTVPSGGGVFMPYGPLLIMEDRDDDVYALQRALGKTLPCAFVRCRTGGEAVGYVFQQGAYTQAVHLSLILLDLNLPGKDGHSVLKYLKRDAALCDIPAVILSTSNKKPTDVKCYYGAYAAVAVIKLLTYDCLRQALQDICPYWFHTMALPDRKN
jgi:chemotaxis family two-component system response regulator Rcp1